VTRLYIQKKRAYKIIYENSGSHIGEYEDSATQATSTLEKEVAWISETTATVLTYKQNYPKTESRSRLMTSRM
jgi:hypothetical protein